jgi:Na+-transporting NADH:ubiquinone oxidoreductase subunit NqrC
LLIINNQLLHAQVDDEIIQSFKTGDSKTLSEYFNQNIELVVLDNDNVYSKAQAQQIVSKFFDENQPERFSVIHQGGKEGAQYVIGSLETKSKSFRIYFLLKKNGQKDYIHQLRIEEQ